MVSSDPRWPAPEEASRGGADQLRDEQLPLLAAEWLARGYDSSELVQLATMTSTEARSEARRLLPEVIASLGLRFVVADLGARSDPDALLRSSVAWAVGAMEDLFTPYAAAHMVLVAIEDEASLQQPAEPLWELVRAYEASPRSDRADVQRRIADELWRLRAVTVGVGASGERG